jgi:hypothetical protein
MYDGICCFAHSAVALPVIVNPYILSDGSDHISKL